MGKIIDITNQKFGNWTVLQRGANKNGRAYWLCKCICGTIREVSGKSLRSGISQSCGCQKKGTKLNLLGERFGNLVVIQEAPNKDNGRTAWLCQCDCGNTKIIGTKELRNGETKSCGCLRDKIITTDILGQRFGKLLVIERDYENQTYEGAFWKCKCDCGNIITVSGKNLRLGHTLSCGCLNSKGEALIAILLSQLNISYKQQYIFPDCLTENGHPCRFDFAIIENEQIKCLIEYDGIQHYIENGNFGSLEQNQKRDQIKNTYCEKHNIPLLRIPYWEYQQLNSKYLLERIENICQPIADLL